MVTSDAPFSTPAGRTPSPDAGRRKFSYTLQVCGELAPASFESFVRARANRLELALLIHSLGPTAATLTVHGQPDLVDAFEMACALGPSDCLVETVEAA